MSPVNWGDAFVQAMRTVLVTVSGLPTTRCWANTITEPPQDAASVDDAITAMRTEPAECGPGAIKRVVAQYRVVLYVPLGGDIHAVMSLAAAVESAFYAASVAGTLAVLGNPVEVLAIDWREAPGAALFAASVSNTALFAVPVTITATFDHP